MKKRIAAWMLGSLLVGHVSAALKEGDKAPDFQAQAALSGKAVAYALGEARKRGPVVVYFFPTSYGGGCSVQAHAFSQHYDRFAAAGASIVGVTLDSLARLQDFSADPDYCAGKFPVVSDVDGAISRAYQLKVESSNTARKDRRGNEATSPRVERTTFVIGTDGQVLATVGDLTPEQNVLQALKKLQAVAGAR